MSFMEGRSNGAFHTGQGSLFQGNSFITSGGPIHFDSGRDNQLPASVCELPEFILSPHFTGRADELGEINRWLSNLSDGKPRRVIIHGMPGLGKTQLALEFATRAYRESLYPYVFWVSAASTEKLAQEFSRLADLLCLPGRHGVGQNTKLTIVRAWLENRSAARSWLVIFDNVDQETVALLRDVIPRAGCNGRLIMTTRTAATAELFAIAEETYQLALQPPGKDDAMQILSAGADVDQESWDQANFEAAQQLVKSVGFLPLAINQAASYVRDTGTHLDEVLGLYKSSEVSGMLSWKNDLERHEEKSVVAIFLPALTNIQEENPDAAILLKLFCFCDPEGIQLSIFKEGCNLIDKGGQGIMPTRQTVDHNESRKTFRNKSKRSRDRLHQSEVRQVPERLPSRDFEDVKNIFNTPLRLSKAIQVIERLSLAAQTSRGTEKTMRIHDLIHLLLRSNLMADAERTKWLEIAVNIVCKGLETVEDPDNPGTWSRYAQFVSHIESLNYFATAYSIKNIQLLKADDCICEYLIALGSLGQALNISERTLDQKKKILGEQHPNTLSCICQQASILSHQGEFAKALGILRRVLTLQESILGQEHEDTAGTRQWLGSVLNREGKYGEAEQIARQTIASTQSRQGIRTAKIYHYAVTELSYALIEQGKYGEAEVLQRQNLDYGKSHYGKEHVWTLEDMGGLGTTLWRQRKFEEAESMLSEAVALGEVVLGHEHPHVLSFKHDLAITLSARGNLEDAERLYSEILPKSESSFGEEHPDVLTIKTNMALLLSKKGQAKEAETMQRRIMSLGRSILGREHPNTLIFMNNLACTLNEQSRNNEAIPLMEECAQLQRKVLGQDHPYTQGSFRMLSEWKTEQEQEANGQQSNQHTSPND